MVRKKKEKKKNREEEGGAVRKRGGESRNQKRRRREKRRWARDESNGPKRGEPDQFGSRKKPNRSSLYIRARGPV